MMVVLVVVPCGCGKQAQLGIDGGGVMPHQTLWL
jgi:hypothetical protein